ncbi:MAG: thioredoxin family protein [Planctomycetaceae bacterium]|nr:thioredoxin family protein [Planctomycetaceae bacterium]
MERIILLIAAVIIGAMLVWVALFPPNPQQARVPDILPPEVPWFEQEVLQARETVIVDFGAAWCGPCRVLKPMLDQLETEFAGRVKIVPVDIDEEPELSAHYKVDGVPYMFVYRDGELVAAVQGLIPDYTELVQFIRPHLPPPAAVSDAEADPPTEAAAGSPDDPVTAPSEPAPPGSPEAASAR